MTKGATEDASPEELAELERRFTRDGWVHLGPVFSATKARALRSLVDEGFARAAAKDAEQDRVRAGVALMRVFELDNAFRDLIVLNPIATLAERLLGQDSHLISQTALRTPPGKAINNWHIDDALFFPEQGDRSKDAPAAPCFIVSFMILLTDVTDHRHGPTEFVSGSHRSGRRPPSTVVSASEAAYGLAGQSYAFNSQTWHRGAANVSKRTRYVIVMTYGCRFISQRFYPFLTYRMPPRVLRGADTRLLKFLGRHEKGPYG